jgi:hypothetical protein
LHELETLDMHNLFDIGDVPMRHVRRMPALRFIGLHGTMVSDAGLAHLAGLEHLDAVLPGPLTTDAGLTVLHDLPAFVDADRPRAYLGMGKSPLISDAGLRTVGELAGLERLWLGETRLLQDRWVDRMPAQIARAVSYTGAGLAPLARLPHLREFTMAGDRMDDDAMEHIGRFAALDGIGCALAVAGDRGWQGLAQSRSLTRIGAFECDGLTGAGVKALAAMPQLVDLEVAGKRLHDEDLVPLMDMQNLRAFCCGRGNVFTDKAYEYIARIPRLERLSTGIARTIGDDATVSIARMPHLKELHLSGWQMTDRTCELLADAPALEDLSLRVRRLTDAGLEHLSRCPTLQRLKMDDCPFITEAGVARLKQGIELDWNPGTVRNLIEAVIEDETVRDRAVQALADRGQAAQQELRVFADIVPEQLREVFQRLLQRLETP